ncbi:hypothetical protein Cch01nite_03950 [Cellulomonas chitinilytica]|uniref:DUF4352 domain-containing protein n=1 Tax=Cellulomonas chitinilytica TaxID=398759 RepID=A0A919TZR4_9CELL|nr:hypothetical protein [Cellulomonas chitinilytica]GIG19671.1 hypothetical protein Cch01nite_03950 [Cellulomonas chitinilytica]
MSDETVPTPGRPAWVLWTGAGVLVVAVVLAVVLLVRGSGDDAAGAASPSASSSAASASPTASTAPSASAEPEPSATAEPGDGQAQPGVPGATPGPDGRPTAAPVALDAPAQPADGVTTQLVSIEPVTGEATLPGEVGGPSLRFTVSVVNRSGPALDLSAAVVNAYTGDALAPATPLLKPGGRPFPGQVAAGGSVTGVFVFNVPEAERGHVRLEVDLGPDLTVVLFEGSVPQ